jgi:predicted phosphodiesterase
LDWLANLPATHTLGGDILLCHGTPRDDLEYLLEDVNRDQVQLASTDRIETRLAGTGASLVFCGHSHIPRVVMLPGKVWIVNPGSVGLPAYDVPPAHYVKSVHYVENGSPYARYAVIDWSPKAVKVDFIAVTYDWESAAREAAQADRPDWAHALATGYALRPNSPGT